MDTLMWRAAILLGWLLLGLTGVYASQQFNANKSAEGGDSYSTDSRRVQLTKLYISECLPDLNATNPDGKSQDYCAQIDDLIAHYGVEKSTQEMIREIRYQNKLVLISLIAAAIAAVAAYWTFREQRRQGRAASRAYVQSTKAGVYLAGEDQIGILLRLENFGATPANDVRAFLHIDFWGDGCDPHCGSKGLLNICGHLSGHNAGFFDMAFQTPKPANFSAHFVNAAHIYEVSISVELIFEDTFGDLHTATQSYHLTNEGGADVAMKAGAVTQLARCIERDYGSVLNKSKLDKVESEFPKLEQTHDHDFPPFRGE